MKSTDIKEVITSMPQQSERPYFNWAQYHWKKVALEASDFLCTVGATSFFITTVQSPINSALFNLMKINSFVDPKLPFLTALSSLYRGSISSAQANTIRGAYVVGAKRTTTMTEEASTVTHKAVHESHASEHSKGLFEASVADISKIESEPNLSAVSQRASSKSGMTLEFMEKAYSIAKINICDIAITQTSENKAQLEKAGIMKHMYKFDFSSSGGSNRLTVFKTGLGSRFLGGMLNFGGLCHLTDFYAKNLPGENQQAKQAAGGMLSGMTASLGTFPFSYYKDYMLEKVTVNQEKLAAPKSLDVLTDMQSKAKKMTLEQYKQIFVSLRKQIILRAIRTGFTFAIVAGINSAMGATPVSKYFKNTDETPPTHTNNMPLESPKDTACHSATQSYKDKLASLEEKQDSEHTEKTNYKA